MPPPPPPPVVSEQLGSPAGDEVEDNRYRRRPVEGERRNVVLRALHDCPEAMSEHVVSLLTQRWPRSDAVRAGQLDSSCSDFPISLVMVVVDEPELPLGYVRLQKCVENPHGILAESIIVSEDLRGMGYGGELMRKMHQFVRDRGYKAIHLCTQDKRDFYQHVGYKVAEPVSAVSPASQMVDSAARSKLERLFGGSASVTVASFSSQYIWLKLVLE